MSAAGARLKKDPYDLNYSADHTGEFGSGARRVSAPTAVRPATLSPAAQARILGTVPATGQTSAQVADQAAFDRSFGFEPTQSNATLTPKKPPTNVPVTPAMRTMTPVAPRATALDGLTAQPVDPFSGITLNSRPPVLNTDITRAGPVFPVAPTPPVAPAPPSRAEVAGQTTRRVIGDVLGAIPKETAFGSTVVHAPAEPDKPVLNIPRLASNFFRGFNSSASPAGVTNATAAQFQTPTKENPVPVTDTSPETKIDQSQSSLAKFGLSEDELTKRKRLFAGF